jgi:hypothetical protein
MCILRALLTFVMVAAAALSSRAAAGQSLRVWPVDPHVKVFRDTLPGAAGTVTLRAARNEYEPGQFAVRSGGRVQGLRVELSPLRRADGAGAIGREHLRWNFVGFIPLKKNTPESEVIRVRKAPCEVPDPLLEARSIDLAPNVTQPVWITVFVPKDAQSGQYRGEATVIAGQARATLPVELTVDPFTLPDQRHVLVTNWFTSGNIAKSHKVEPWSEAFWAVLERYARDMAAHRQNVVLAPWDLIGVARGADGRLAFDYQRFDRFVELFQRAGVSDGIEITHVGGGKNGWGTEIQFSTVHAHDRKTGKPIALGPEEGLFPLLSDLEKHLAKRGWLDKAMIHIADEPCILNLASWKKASALVHKAAPRLRRVEAVEMSDCIGALEIWVPKLSHFDRWRAAYEAQRKGNEFWFYICCHPYGNFYPNRFLDYPLSRVRVLHWMNFSEDLRGYLHWGWNFWGGDPFGPPSDELPPGDTHVVYPGSQGPLDSVRWEMQRESLEDFEYLELLAAKTAAVQKQLGPAASWVDPRRRAVELSRRVVRAVSDTEVDPAKIQAARREIAAEILAIDQPPLVLIQTEPAENCVLVEGPITVELRGVVQAGAKVKLNGTPVAVQGDGTFLALAGPQIRIEAERDGKKKTMVRSFKVRKN